MMEWFLKKLRVGVQEAVVGGVGDAWAELTGQPPPVLDAESSASGVNAPSRLPSAAANNKRARKKGRAAVG